MSKDLIVCPACQTENDALRRICVGCGESLIVVCPRCNIVNAITADHCSACGQQFDMLGQIIARHEVRFEDRFTRQAATAGQTRAAQQATDQARSQQLWSQERQRQEYLQAQKLRQKQQERYLIVGTVIASMILLTIVVITSLAR